MNDKKSIALPLGEKLRFENGRLYLGEAADAPSMELATFDGGKRPVDDIGLPVLQACYGLIRNGILDLASRGEAPGIMFSVTVSLDAFLNMIGYDGSEDDDARVRYAWDSIKPYCMMYGVDGSGAAVKLLSIVGIDFDGAGRRTIELMSNCINQVAAKVLEDDNDL